MNEISWLAPDVDEQGFVALTKLARRVADLEPDQFLLAYPAPALLVVHRDADLQDGDAIVDPNDSRVQLLTMSIKSAAILRYLNKIGFVCKRPGNPFAHLISVGRSTSNDLVISVETVSKVHGYFVRDEEAWFFNDRSSTNGSLINDRLVKPGVRTPIRDGDILQLGLEVNLQFMMPHSLYRHLRKQV